MQPGNLFLSESLKRCRFLLAFLLGVSMPVLFLAVWHSLEADTASLELTGDGSIESSEDTCGGNGAYDCLDDGVTIPGSVNGGEDFVILSNTKDDFYLLDTIGNVATVTEVVLNYYHGEGGASAFATLGIYAANEATQYGTTQNIPNRSLPQWDTATITSIALTQAQLDDLRVKLDCEKSGGGPSYSCNGYALYADIDYVPRTNVRVAAIGSQQNIDVGSTTAYVGGAFYFTEVQNCTSCAIDSITITESGSVNAQTDLSNIRLYYELDNASPYCSDQTFSGTENQFGTTDTNGFSGPDGTATFTGNVSISATSVMCVYVVFDIGSGAAAGETIEISIADPSSEVSTALDQIVRPTNTLPLSGTTVLQAVQLDQTHFHWRNDNGNEADPGGASSATGGSENVNYDTLSIGSPIRLRMEVANLGNKTSDGEQYRIEYGKKVSTCENLHVDSSWVDVGAGGGDFDMYDSDNLTHASDTTDIAVSIGGVTNATTTFLTSNGAILDTSSQSGTITLASGELVELEYSIVATSNAVEGNKYCFRVTDASSEIDNYTRYPEVTILADLNVDTEGVQPTYLDIPDYNVEIGGFNFFAQTPGEKTIASTTITATGTINVANDIEEIRLLYDLDVTNPYNCGDESLDGDELQYGSTDTDGFTAVSGTSTFIGSVVASTTQAVCMYVVLNVATSTADGSTLEVRIANPNEDVGTTIGTVSPAALLDLDGESTAVKPILTINHYHWRDDTSSEANAPSATGAEDTEISLWKVGVPKRLRFDVSNEGSTTTASYQYRLEYATKVSICSEATGWVDVGLTDDQFNMYNSDNVTDGDDTTNIGTSTGGVTNNATSFLTNNNGVKDTSSETDGITLLGDQFTELEYSVVASSTTVEGKTYCFRLTNAGSEIDGHNIYAEATIKPPTDFYVQRGVSTITGTSLTVSAGPNYIAPSSSSTAFVRITNTQLTGAGDSGAPANSNSDDVTVYISNAANLATSFDLVRTGGAGDTRVAWEIVEFTGSPGSNNEIVVREQSFVTLGTATTGASTAAVSNIQNDSDVVVFITGQGNRATDRTNYNAGLATASWGGANDVAYFQRGTIGGGTALDVSYAVVEFVGSNWNIQRVEHTYSQTTGTTETASTTAVGSLARAFLHTQKRVGSGLNTHANIGHEVWMSGLGQVSFRLDSEATTPGGHTSVAWLIENTQSNGTPMIVSRSNGPQSGGAEPGTFNIGIGKTLNDIDIASIFINNRSNGTVTTFPQPMMAARLLNNGTQYELWVSKTTNIRNYRTEVVEWPTGAREITQNYYRFYVDNDLLDPDDPWPAGVDNVGDNTPVTIYNDPIAIGESVRLRMTLQVNAAKMNPGVDTFKLQYGEMSGTCGGIQESDWRNLGGPSSTTVLWRAHDGSETDGTALSGDPPTGGDLNLTAVADVAGTYEETNPTAAVPFRVDPGEDVEYDWSIENYAAKEKTDYCFRMIEANGTLLEDYIRHPTMRTAGYTPVLNNWRFFEDEENLTPFTPLAATNTSPTDIAFGNAFKLRTTIEETTGGDGENNKFKLQYSEYSDFSKEVYDVVATSTCTASSTWCYADGAGDDNTIVDSATLADADSCTGGSGNGCGTHNESAASSTATYDQPALSMAEYEFTVVHSGARANAVYYFRLYDVANATTVPASTTNPSLVTEGASLVFTVDGLPSGTTTEGVITDATTTVNAILFGEVPIGQEYEAAHRITVDTNATEGYQVFAFSRGDFQSSFGAEIPNVTGTNQTPQGWSIGCSEVATGCFGYHTGDDLLENGSARFAPTDSYAAFSSTTPEEILYNSVPTTESHNIIYKIQVDSDQPAGQYETDVVYLAVPSF